MEDNRIVELLWGRSEQAIEAISEKYGNLIRQIAMNVLNDAEDVAECVNDTYLGVWNRIPPARPQKLMPYVCRIARNLSLKRYRDNTAKRRDYRKNCPITELEDCLPSPSVEEMWSARELGRTIDCFLDTIEPESRVMFVRRYWFSDSVTEIADRMGKSENGVSVRLSRVKKRLKAYWEREGIDV